MEGLTSAQVAAAKTNDVPRRTSRSLSAIIRANVLTLFNLVIGVLWALILIFGEWQDSLFGLVIVANAMIGIVQELRAKRTLDRLAVVNEAPVTVRRDGRDQQIHSRHIVLGDLILLGPGDRLLVDGEVVASQGLEIDESLLTGEADPVRKQPGDQVLSGSFAVAGSGAFTATRVGEDAYAAQLTEQASAFSLAHSELRDGVTKFIKYITWLVIPIGALLLYSQVRNDEDFGSAITGAVAGIVTMIPEGLVLMTSIAFAVGVVRLGQRNALVQELPAIEGLARVDVLCLDKTGTLTAGGMELGEVIRLRDDAPIDDALGALAHADSHPNATAQAIQAGYASPPGWTATELVPFSSARKWSGATFDGHGSWSLGAPDVLLSPDHQAYGTAATLAATGARVIALCRTEENEPVALITLCLRRDQRDRLVLLRTAERDHAGAGRGPGWRRCRTPGGRGERSTFGCASDQEPWPSTWRRSTSSPRRRAPARWRSSQAVRRSRPLDGLGGGVGVASRRGRWAPSASRSGRRRAA
ncbi:HAD-IC family P-type ATPase [Nonomuraea dietziae]|uniref:HAD-IC family P-type ATPase n=1 Tax=Nonomuraea dietziae TaxID=65515 RepID=UPI0031E46467